MQKIYMMIAGSERPYSILGDFLFEDERFYVVIDGQLKKKIPWKNILYIEDIFSDDSFEEDHPTIKYGQEENNSKLDLEKEDNSKLDLEKEDNVEVAVIFTGHKNQAFNIQNVERSLLKGKEWSPALSKKIFLDKQIKAFMGDFVVKNISIEGTNIYITTVPILEEKVIPMKNSESRPDLLKSAETLKSGLGMIEKVIGASGAFNKPSTTYPTNFSMISSPFDAPVSLKNSSEE